MISRFEEFMTSLNDINLYWYRIASSEMKKFGLKGNCAIYFIKLYNLEEGATAARLCELCGKNKANVSREIKRLQELGLVKREITDKRGYRAPITLTKEGKELAESINEKVNYVLEAIDQVLTKEESDSFRSSFKKISQAVKKLSVDGLS